MANIIRHELPRRNPDGTTSVYCRTCGREIARRASAQIRSVNKCALCVLEAQGVKDAEKYVLPQYFSTDPSKPVIPFSAEDAETMYMMFPEERPPAGEAPPPVGGIIGTAKAIFRALGCSREIEVKQKAEVPVSGKTAAKRRKTTLYD